MSARRAVVLAVLVALALAATSLLVSGRGGGAALNPQPEPPGLVA